MYIVKSTNPEDITSFNLEVVVESGLSAATYPTLFEIGSTLVLFYRGNYSTDQTISRALSIDGGSTWTDVINITTYYPYYQVRKDTNDRIHLVWHAKPSANENIYYVYSDDITSTSPTWKTADGTTVSIPLGITDALVFDSTGWDNCYILGCIPDDLQGIHIFAYLSHSTNTDQLVHFRWSGSAWVQIIIAEENLTSWTLGSIQGDVKFQDGNIYLLSEYIEGGISENKEWVSYDRGLTWQFNRYVTVGSVATTANPFYIKDSREYGWFEGSDDYGVGKKIYKGELPDGDMKTFVYDPQGFKEDIFSNSIRIAKAEVLYTNTTQTTIITLPAGAVIWDVGIDVDTAFNDSGTDLLDIGITSTANDILNDYDVSTTSFANQLLSDNPYKITSSTDVTFIYTGQNSDATQGQAFIYIHYSLH